MFAIMKKRTVGVVGLGHVGAHVAYSLAIQGIADELILVDLKDQKLASEVQDLRDSVAYRPPAERAGPPDRRGSQVHHLLHAR